MDRSDFTVFVGPITSLADGRFYAAMGVDYLVFDFREDAASKVTDSFALETIGWVTGPEPAAWCDSPTQPLIAAFDDQPRLYADVLANYLHLTPRDIPHLNRVDPDSFGLFIDLSTLLDDPNAHYDLVGDWLEQLNEEE